MFRKRDDSLRRLHEELLAEEAWDEDELEEEYEEEEDFGEYEEEFDEYEEEDDSSDDYDDEVICRTNYANRYRRGSPKEFDYLPEEEDMDDGDYLDRKGLRKSKRRRAGKNLGWTILALLEVLAIAAIAAWWASWVL